MSWPYWWWRLPASNGVIAAIAAGVLLSCLVAGCSTPGPAPVVSREKAQPTRVASGYRFHRVQRGDTLYSISWQHGLEFQNVALWNGIAPPYRIYPGQRIRLTPPNRSSRTSARMSTARASTPPPPPKRPAAPASKPGPRTGASATAPDQDFDHAGPLQWGWPAKGPVASSFSPDDPSRKGIDIAGRLGEPVVASEAGKVVYAGSGLIGYGRLVILKHNKNYLSAYGYNRRLLVNEGDKVKRGERLAEMGKDIHGNPRLHFEIRRNGTPVNPINLLPRSAR